jgi:hypothetical protein
MGGVWGVFMVTGILVACHVSGRHVWDVRCDGGDSKPRCKTHEQDDPNTAAKHDAERHDASTMNGWTPIIAPRIVGSLCSWSSM